MLKTLPGIGDAKAADIIAYREEHGAFSSIEDIKNVSGIGESIYNRISSGITVN
jgi:competence protein ComEA